MYDMFATQVIFDADILTIGGYEDNLKLFSVPSLLALHPWVLQ